jgi:glycosyltransferase involved in cell wall biosynthesis
LDRGGANVTVSIVIPAHDAGRFLRQTIESVLGQTVTDWELVVVDDGSSDDTIEIARSFSACDPRIRTVHQANSGVAHARNRGFTETTPSSRYVIFLDADDVWDKEALRILVTRLDSHLETVAASGLSRMIDDEGQSCEPGELEIWGRRRQGVVAGRLIIWPVQQPTTLAVLAYRNCIYTPGQMLVRRAMLEAVGPFDPVTSPCEDWDMSLRLSQRGDIAFVDRVVLNWRAHHSNASQQHELMARQMLFVRQKLLSSSDLTEEQRRTIVTANRFWSRRVAAAELQHAKVCLVQGRLQQAAYRFRSALAGYLQALQGAPAA